MDHQGTSNHVPSIRKVGGLAPFRWLAGAWHDMRRAPVSLLVYGLVVAALSFALCAMLIVFNAAFWVLVLTSGFVFIAPMLAMGIYEAGRLIELGEQPTLRKIAIVRSALRQDVAYLGTALLFIYLFWGRIAQVVYGLSTYRLHHTVSEFVDFAIGTDEGHAMLLSGSLIGGVIAFFTYSLVVVSAPMLLDHRTTMFAAVFTSVRVINKNFIAMMTWALLIVALVLASAATGFLALTVVFPWLGLASWRAYRDLVSDPAETP